MRFLYLLSIPLLFVLSCKTQNTGTTGNSGNSNHKYTNRLAKESSPYLLQHAHNPVDWQPWDRQSLAQAKEENKLIIISVGYSSCHWCHVMEHESFEDTAVARIMNEHFVNIKVDREERPDVDDVYMTACHLSKGGSCGWPLNAFALPDGRPIWAGTYFPKEDWLSILEQFIKLKTEKPGELLSYAEAMASDIQNREEVPINLGKAEFKAEDVSAAANRLVKTMDLKWGGRKTKGEFGNKFPMPDNHRFLLREYALSGNSQALLATEVSLDKMAAGGIYDQLGGGFARYSTDPRWKVPHFEKMMYDNGQLVGLYAEAYTALKKPRYKEVVEQTLDYVSREMTDPSGGFYSSLDADSEGVEGKFYVFTKEEVEAVIKDKTALTLFCDYYNVIPGGNWEHSNVLHSTDNLSKIALKKNMTLQEAESSLAESRALLMAERDKRIRPGLDDKVLTAWNALMLSGYIDAYKAFGNKSYKTVALKNAKFIADKAMKEDGRLTRNYKDGKAVVNAFLDDYALTIKAFIQLYQITFDEQWLLKARKLTDYALLHFYDAESGMFYFTSDLDDPLVIRKIETDDNVIAGSNSAMAEALFLVGTFFYEPSYIDKAERMVNNMKETLLNHPQPSFFSNWLEVMSMIASPPFEVAVLGPDSDAMAKELQTYFLPHALFLGGKTEGTLQLLEDKLVEGETYIYVCRNKTCKRPVQTVQEALEVIRTY